MIGRPKVKMVSSFTYSQVVPNLSEFLTSVEHKSKYFKECWLSNSWH